MTGPRISTEMINAFSAEADRHHPVVLLVTFRPSADMEMLSLVLKQFPFGLAIGLTRFLFFNFD
jgi:hypothetical protein